MREGPLWRFGRQRPLERKSRGPRKTCRTGLRREGLALECRDRFIARLDSNRSLPLRELARRLTVEGVPNATGAHVYACRRRPPQGPARLEVRRESFLLTGGFKTWAWHFLDLLGGRALRTGAQNLGTASRRLELAAMSFGSGVGAAGLLTDRPLPYLVKTAGLPGAKAEIRGLRRSL